ncbi:hypothetical protein RGU70_07045 [Herbaspirillum sp. RTI4]|uniref:hypothetical protein n=1 Tax=Herbaspirillum sp. RTI4 TaxID=3048640 RepID=UPI002AB4AAF8|nr:hypothetical protein [Herbaspirillum sp. RTI4]MDY7578073.1 hypothetical protein [Herbaspirillum sp. RTI4]MEA9983424.1 hypothetical protein [Herbaspirillum sp. RTI4]
MTTPASRIEKTTPHFFYSELATMSSASRDALPLSSLSSVSLSNASQTIDSMSRNTGSPADFFTADGASGRLVYGSFVEPLPPGEQLQCSCDGGISWIDATSKDGKWVALDQLEHTSDWLILARTVNSAGDIGAFIAMQEVRLKKALAAPSSVSLCVNPADGSAEALVTLGSKEVALEGDIVRVTVLKEGETKTFERIVMADNAGETTMIVPLATSSYANASSISLSAQHIDTEGNVSAPQYKDVRLPQRVVTFDDEKIPEWITLTTANTNPASYLPKVMLWDDGDSKLYFSDQTMAVPASRVENNIATATSEPSAQMDDGGVLMSMQLSGTENQFNFDLINLRPHGKDTIATTIEVNYSYLDAGQHIMKESHTLNDHGAAYAVSHYEYTLPAEMKGFTAMELRVFTSGVALDNLTFTDNSPHLPVAAPDLDIGIAQFHTIAGTAGDDVFTLSDPYYFTESSAGIYGGEGIDTLKFNAAGMQLDLSTRTDESTYGNVLHSIEIVEMQGQGANQLTLSANDVLSIGSRNAFSNDGKLQIAVHGDGDDTVCLQGLLDDKGNEIGMEHWQSQDDLLHIDGVNYQVYDFGSLSAQLLVETGMTVTLL